MQNYLVLFLLQIWFQVKAANPHLSVCQIGATIGRMWRELSEAEKQRHLEEFQQDKVPPLLLSRFACTHCIDVACCHSCRMPVSFCLSICVCVTNALCKNG